MSLYTRAVVRATTPTKSGWTATKVAADVVKYGGTAIVVLEAIENVGGVSAPVQGGIAAAVTILTAVLSVLKQQDVATAQAAAKLAVKAAKKAVK